jgi:hypothetical protein
MRGPVERQVAFWAVRVAEKQEGPQRPLSSRLRWWCSERVDHAEDERAEQDEQGGLDGGV